MEPSPVDPLTLVSSLPDGWVKAMGVRFVAASTDEVEAELDVSSVHLQPFGIVHGGVYSGLVETVTSVGAGVAALAQGRFPVGLENHTSFLHAVREGKLRARARPLAQGKTSAVWEARIVDDRERLVAHGTVRFLVLERGAALGGEGVGLKPAV
jgi:uncharacterized protein (TIGR00369 family)